MLIREQMRLLGFLSFFNKSRHQVKTKLHQFIYELPSEFIDIGCWYG